jgi:hypothetical protein
MSKTCSDPLIIAVWVRMAEHFLDTETRHDLPLTALCCVEAGLSGAQARDVWQHEVSPAVGFNLYSLVGEWAYWDEEWLVQRIERARASRRNRSGLWSRLRSSMPPLMSGQWQAIERCIEFLEAIPSAAERKRVAGELAQLARHSFDVCPQDPCGLEAEERERLRKLYPTPFRSLIEVALQRSERADAERRLQRALSGVVPWT